MLALESKSEAWLGSLDVLCFERGNFLFFMCTDCADQVLKEKKVVKNSTNFFDKDVLVVFRHDARQFD